MCKSRFSDEQIIAIVREHAAGLGADELRPKHRISDATWHDKEECDLLVLISTLLSSCNDPAEARQRLAEIGSEIFDSRMRPAHGASRTKKLNWSKRNCHAGAAKDCLNE